MTHPLTPTRRIGQVISISPTPTPTVEVAIGGNTSQTDFVPYVDSYIPAVNDYVLLLGNQGDYVVVGGLVGLYGWPVDYTPAWTSSSGTPPAVNNGTLTGRYQMVGPKHCALDIALTFGSTTTAGTSGNWSFSLPFTSAAREQELLLKMFTAGNIVGFGIILASAATAQAYYQASATMLQLGFNQPTGFTTNSNIHLIGTYETA